MTPTPTSGSRKSAPLEPPCPAGPPERLPHREVVDALARGTASGGCSRERSTLMSEVWVLHRLVPTECLRCGAAGFSNVAEVAVRRAVVMHWVRPPSGWYLLREQRLSARVTLITARCEGCVAAVVNARSPPL